MREILFKAKRKDSGEWVEGSLVSTEGGKRFILPSKTILFAPRNRNTICSAECYKVDSDTLCQYTGLTDKNGKKIWENDICIVKDRTLDKHGYFVCKWDIDAARCVLKGIFTVDFYGINEIEKYAGYFPVTNELLADSDAVITNVLTEWIGNESRVTRNNVILSVIKEKAVTELTNLDDVKKALNVTLGAAFKATSKIITNDDGLQYLDTLKDNDGNYLLQPNPADPMQLRLCAGSTIVPIEVIPNSEMPSDTKTAQKRKIPFIIGDLKEGIKFFDRQQLSIMSSNVAVAGSLNAFEEDLTMFRAIEREDCKTKDDEAFVNGQITIDDKSVAGEVKKGR